METFLKNIALDIVMGLLCVFLAFTIIGMIFIPIVLDTWSEMRKNDKGDK